MREFKKNTWTMIKRLSLGLALAVPGLYQGHAQAQNIVLNFNGTITAPLCLLRVTPTSGPTIASGGSGSINLPTLLYNTVLGVASGDPITASVTFKVDMSSPAGGTTNCASASRFQVIVMTTNVNSVDTSTGRTLLVNPTTSSPQVGLEIAARNSLNPGANFTPIASLSQNSLVINVITGVSSQTLLQPAPQTSGYFEFSLTPVKIAAAGTAFTQTTYGGSITLQTSYN